MSRFNQTENNVAKSTVAVGAGVTWDQVYAVLNGSGFNVAGGSDVGVGVAGFTLGGASFRRPSLLPCRDLL